MSLNVAGDDAGAEPDVDLVVAAVSSSKKYRSICPDTIRRLARRELDVHGNVKRATKGTKRRLHQVYGAFEEDVDYGAAFERLASVYATGSKTEIELASRQLLSRHNSTAERLPILDDFYRSLWEATSLPASVMDLGCGLSPLALPWMALPDGVPYIPLDIDAQRIHFLNRYLSLAGREPLARCHDVLAQPPGDRVDVALLLKLSPSLERQESGATPHLVEQLRASSVVVSFAVQSLSGREKGMAEQYRRQFLGWATSRRWNVAELAFETELCFVVRHGSAG